MTSSFQSFFPLCFKIAESFENLDNILHDWAKDKAQESLVQALNRNEKQSSRKEKDKAASFLETALSFFFLLSHLFNAWTRLFCTLSFEQSRKILSKFSKLSAILKQREKRNDDVKRASVL